jgi:hypothetical protein
MLPPMVLGLRRRKDSFSTHFLYSNELLSVMGKIEKKAGCFLCKHLAMALGQQSSQSVSLKMTVDNLQCRTHPFHLPTDLTDAP